MQRFIVFIVSALIPAFAAAAVSYQVSFVGSDLYQGSTKIASFSSDAECVEAAKGRPVSTTTTFECRARTAVVATVTSSLPTDTDGDGVVDTDDQCPKEAGPSPSGCPPVYTATKFVSPSGGATSCTQNDPCSLQRAADTAQAGDVVSVAAGRYGTVTISRSGTLTKPIEFRSNGAVIENASGYGIYLKRVSYVTLDGFTVQNTKLKGIAARDASPTSPVRGLVIRNCVIRNIRQEGMYLSEVADSLIEGNTITNVGLDNVETTGHGIYLANAGSDGTTIRRNIIMIGTSPGAALHINGDLSTGGDGIISRVTIDSNILQGGIKGVSGDGVQDSRIVNNLIYGQRQHGIRLYREDGAAGAKGFVIINNTIQAPNAALKATNEVGSSIVFNNILADGKEPSIITGQLSSNLKTFAVTSNYAPTSAAKDKGVTSFGGQNAPTTDISGAARSTPVSIGAFE
jgi:hypothetical protein